MRAVWGIIDPCHAIADSRGTAELAVQFSGAERICSVSTGYFQGYLPSTLVSLSTAAARTLVPAVR